MTTNNYVKHETVKMVENEKVLMPKKYFYRFVDVLRCQSNYKNEKIITHYVIKELERMGISWEIDNVGNILAVKGKAEIYPCVTAHLDTVHDFVSNFKIVEQKGNLYAMSNGKQVGIGGDDKCGVYACLYFLEKYDNIKAVFCTSEEVGQTGSDNIDLKFFDDCGYIIGIDRKGNGDYINRYSGDKTTSEEFEAAVAPALAKYGYKSEYGLVTDSLIIFERKVGKSCINLSCGYYNPHRSEEFININDFWNSVNFVDEMIQALGEKAYPQLPEVKAYRGYYDRDWDYEGGYSGYGAGSYNSRNYNSASTTPARSGKVYYEGKEITNGNIFDEEEEETTTNFTITTSQAGANTDMLREDDGTIWYKIPD